LSLSTTTWTLIPFDTEDQDNGSYWTVSTPGRFTITNTGWYVVTAFAYYNSTSARTLLSIFRNGAPGAGGVEIGGDGYSAASANNRCNASVIAYLTAGDYVEAYTYASTANTMESATTPARFAISRLSGAGPTGATGATGPTGPTVARTYGASWAAASGAIVAADTKIVYLTVPQAGTIQNVRVLAQGGPGSCVIDIWKDTYANYPPTVADTITASAKPTISAASKYEDATLTGWTKTLNAGDVLAFKLDSTSTFTAIQVMLTVT
jgi:hypothetical protein